MRRVPIIRVLGRSGRPSITETESGGKFSVNGERLTLRKRLYVLEGKRGKKNQRIRIKSLLSEREREVFGWLNMGKTSWDISKILGISERTVNYHVGNIMQKLGVNSRIQVVSESHELNTGDINNL